MTQAIDGFMLDKSLNLSHATVAKYRYVLSRFAGFVDDRLIGEVGTVDVRRWLLSLSDGGLSRRTVHDYWAVLSSFWTWAEVELNVGHVIRGHIPAPGYTERVIEPFTEAGYTSSAKATKSALRNRRQQGAESAVALPVTPAEISTG